MIDLKNFSKEETTELYSLIQKNTEKSALEQFYLFTQDDIERAKIFCWCHRILCNVYNLLDESKIKEEVRKEIELTRNKNIKIITLLSNIKQNKILVFRYEKQLFDSLNEDSMVNDLIDAFSVFIERETINTMSKLKGFVLEGSSGKEYKKIFAGETNQPVEVIEEPFEEQMEEPTEDGE